MARFDYIRAIIAKYMADNPSTGTGISLAQVKADTQIASAISNTHASGSDNQDLSGLVVKVTGSSLVQDTEITKLSGVSANAQKNSDITKAEIEAKLTGEISSHTHAGGSGGLTQAQILNLFI